MLYAFCINNIPLPLTGSTGIKKLPTVAADGGHKKAMRTERQGGAEVSWPSASRAGGKARGARAGHLLTFTCRGPNGFGPSWGEGP